MSKKVVLGKVLLNEMIEKDVYKMVIRQEEAAKSAAPGQFVNLYTKSESMLLPRPISICEIGTDTLTLVYGVVGKGTKEFSSYNVGDDIKLTTALGNGFTPADAKVHVLVGGGIGVPPLVELAKHLEGEKIAVIGFREAPFLHDRLEELGVKVYVATDSGAYGFKGNVVELMEEKGLVGDYYYSCGPKPMLRALAAFCEAKGKPVQVSLEERMGCGYGACVGCVCKTKAANEVGYEQQKVCKDGPVFLGSEVVW
ncbi:MAG: dihydroorotate dehydrogenase electron transfer subunit [Zhenhengia sp.]|uniref:dihydroorotate dehydrogenase electron transfer subunit n=1 Tax=Zhenhengia sp. TaxID=2944208 RepID=UPI003993E1B6